jgi:hypothetical protein
MMPRHQQHGFVLGNTGNTRTPIPCPPNLTCGTTPSGTTWSVPATSPTLHGWILGGQGPFELSSGCGVGLASGMRRLGSCFSGPTVVSDKIFRSNFLSNRRVTSLHGSFSWFNLTSPGLKSYEFAPLRFRDREWALASSGPRLACGGTSLHSVSTCSRQQEIPCTYLPRTSLLETRCFPFISLAIL